MATVQHLARPLLASIFITGGIDALLDPGPKAQIAEPVIDLVLDEAAPVAQRVAAVAVAKVEGGTADDGGPGGEPQWQDDEAARGAASLPVPDKVADAVRDVADGGPIPVSREALVRANGAVQVGAGVLLAFGKAPRLASLALTASLVPTTLGGHRFWESQGDERRLKRIAFTKNLGLLGGLLLSAATPPCNCHPAGRATRRAGRSGGQEHRAGRALRTKAEHGLAGLAASGLGAGLTHTVAHGIGHGVERGIERGNDLASSLQTGAHKVADRVVDRAGDVAERAEAVLPLH